MRERDVLLITWEDAGFVGPAEIGDENLSSHDVGAEAVGGAPPVR